MFEKLFRRRKSKEVAKNRLKSVLVQDRKVISSTSLNGMKEDLIRVISRYINIEKNHINIEFNMEPKNRNRGALIVNVPIAKKGV
jgi:cell division topological specificity factor